MHQSNFFEKQKNLVKQIILLFGNPYKAFLISFAIYFLLSCFHGKPWGVSGTPYFNYLADAFLHGQFNLRLDPPSLFDLVLFKNKIFLYWAPFPAILLMPFIAVFGVNFSDILFTIFIGSINISLLTILISELNNCKIICVDEVRRGMLVIFFAFGTVFLTMVPLGRVWFTSIVIGVSCTLLTYIISVKYHGAVAFFFAGVTISAAMATRLHLVFVGLWPAWYLLSTNWTKPKKMLIRYIFAGLIPVLLTTLFIFYYNFTRFGSIMDVGLDYHNMGGFFRNDYSLYGAFNIHYLPVNLFYQYVAYPFVTKDAQSFFMGGSLFLLSPLFFAIVGIFKNKTNYISNIVLGFTIFLINIPILLLMGTGYVQFGPRYTLDFIVPLLILTAIGIRQWSYKILIILILISIIHYFFGYLLLTKVI